MQTPSHPLTPTRRVGQVISISPTPTPTVEVTIGGDTTVTQFVPYVDSYYPVVGDYVVLLGVLGDYFVVGRPAAGTRQTFAPTWNSSSGSAPSVGNGSLSGWFEMVSPSRCNFDIQLVIGSTSSGGSSGVYNFGGLPFAGAATRSQAVSLKIITAATLGGNGAIVFSNSAVSQMFYQTNSAGMTQFGFAAPVLAATNVIQVFGTYEIA